MHRERRLLLLRLSTLRGAFGGEAFGDELLHVEDVTGPYANDGGVAPDHGVAEVGIVRQKG